MMNFVVPLRSAGACDASRCGTKASKLAELAIAGFRVPDGFVVTTAAHERGMVDTVERAIRDAVAALGELPLAVRSSGIEEDLPGASFAGQYETYLDVRGADAVVEAVRSCWASAEASRVAAYRAAHGLEGTLRLAVLVQILVRADSAGVAFSANPITGRRDETVVNAVAGLGERLVGGAATADEWVVDASSAPRAVRVVERAISAQQVAEVAALARRVAGFYRAPQDIEWAFASGVLHLLQARPITALPDVVDWTPPSPGVWLRSFRIGEWLGDPVSPLFDTWLLARLEARLFARFERVVPMPTPRPFHVIVNGWYFTTGNFVPRSPLQAIWPFLRYVIPALFRRAKALGIATTRWAEPAMRMFESEWRAGPREAYARAVSDASSRVDDASPEALIALVDSLADVAGDELFYFYVLGGSTWKLESRLADFHARHLATRVPDGYQDLVQGLGGAEHEGHLALSLDWMHPTLGELGDVVDADRDRARRDEARKRREAAVDRARAALSARLLPRFERVLEPAQHFGRVREEQASRLTLAWPLLRRAVQRLGAHLVDRGVLATTDDVFFLTREELASTSSRVAEVAERRARWASRRRLAPPLVVGKMSALQRKAFVGMQEPFVGASRGDDASLRGLPASPGRATGRVRVIHGPDEFSLLNDGEILVASATNPGWTPLFARAAAVVTDTGSVMAHASLVAREYAIPAVVGTAEATRRLRDGQLVTVDGSAGVVTAHS